MKFSFFTQLALAIAAGALSASSHAATESQSNTQLRDAARARGFSIGIGVVVRDEPIVDLDRNAATFPMLLYQGERWSARGPGVGYDFFQKDNLSIGATVGMRFDGYDPDDSDFLIGMEERERSVDGGLRVEYRMRPYNFSVEAKHDLLSRHDGYELSVNASRLIPIRNFLGGILLIPSIGYSYYSDDLTNYYFGVRDNEATPGRSSYEPGSASEWDVGINTVYPVTEKATLVLGLSHKWYSSEIRNSPIIDDNTSLRLFSGFSYRIGK